MRDHRRETKSLRPSQRSAIRSARAFTLIELMVVVAIIAILALMAVPLYRDKFVREQVIEAIKLTEIARKPIAAAWTLSKALPDDNASAGLPVPDKVVSNYVKSMTVEGGAIHMVFGNQASGALRDKTLSLLRQSSKTLLSFPWRGCAVMRPFPTR